jgi:hypothetical protein
MYSIIRDTSCHFAVLVFQTSRHCYLRKTNSLQTFGKIPSYLHRRQLQLEAEKKERIQAETKQPKPEGRYVTDSERKALLQVSTYLYAICVCQKNRLYNMQNRCNTSIIKCIKQRALKW